MEALLAGASCLAFHPLRSELAAGYDDGWVRLFAFPAGGEWASVELKGSGAVTGLAYDSTGAVLAVGTGNGEVSVFSRAE